MYNKLQGFRICQLNHCSIKTYNDRLVEKQLGMQQNMLQDNILLLRCLREDEGLSNQEDCSRNTLNDRIQYYFQFKSSDKSKQLTLLIQTKNLFYFDLVHIYSYN